MTSKRFRLSDRFSIDISYDLDSLEKEGVLVEWVPELPTDPLTERELERYRAARDSTVMEIERKTNRSVLVIDA